MDSLNSAHEGIRRGAVIQWTGALLITVNKVLNMGDSR